MADAVRQGYAFATGKGFKSPTGKALATPMAKGGKVSAPAPSKGKKK